ncbi:MAG: biopolymer transporter ExbD [Candidatus Latescibacterota bacterium]|nr:MAG: biopolymer transporter ExbD [Candidatus Latescibacterota bacterium]RKY63883.1 MAG: biopolymer transporter ExbD [Candidatus Latescibacterota bacterium]RKY70772.1 MAG: biopolymer transporter ExbD [Candidatus Latescibacterota bacterium]HDH99775.1 biopolymer transporter ExbD [Bacillota bacterium]
MALERRSKVEVRIPTASMADIAFLLLIFFMVSTTFVRYRGLPVELPEAEKIQRIETRRNLVYIWITKDGKICVNDMLADLNSLEDMMSRRMRENPRTIVSLRADEEVPYGKVSEVLQVLRRAEALRVNFATRKERR